MFQEKKQKDYKSLWIASLLIIALGLLFTFRLAMIRPLGFLLLGVGGVMLVVSLINMNKWRDREDQGPPRRFN
jgi:predicted exporter